MIHHSTVSVGFGNLNPRQGIKQNKTEEIFDGDVSSQVLLSNKLTHNIEIPLFHFWNLLIVMTCS